MMNDPLLPPPPPPAAKPKAKVRRPGVANSAKILATGLATTATLGMTAGYALASQPENKQTPTNANLTNSQTVPQQSTDSSSSTAPQSTSPQVTTPPQTQPPVVEIPVPTIAPADPGNNWGNSGNNQTSNGSR